LDDSRSIFGYRAKEKAIIEQSRVWRAEERFDQPIHHPMRRKVREEQTPESRSFEVEVHGHDSMPLAC
jgi:hypothetical protein